MYHRIQTKLDEYKDCTLKYVVKWLVSLPLTRYYFLSYTVLINVIMGDTHAFVCLTLILWDTMQHQ